MKPRAKLRYPLVLAVVLTLLCAATLLYLVAVVEFSLQPDAPGTNVTGSHRPVYAIAHRVLTRRQISQALRQGANALEVDVTAWKDGWFGDHDGVWERVGDPVEVLFRAVAGHRQTGRDVAFVWLDIKDPDWCDPQDDAWQNCSVAALQEHARQILEPAGVRVLYGFAGDTAEGVGYGFISRHVDGNEAVNLDGDGRQLRERFRNSSITDVSRRVLSYGSSSVTWKFGNCYEDEHYTCTVLRQAVESGEFGRVFAWTLHAGAKRSAVDFLFGSAGIDGVIYGSEDDAFRDDLDTRAVYQDIRDWVEANRHGRYWASANDSPW
ncbi:phospholipase D [Metarhizium album ARSEF 1941]|uniref:Phospholipase D n=1 Tax=Metarhizium album (strain ARSEF 1941) TaxID=1081103 RepID=A0A0B2WJA9_METAS|nr:phospholipase D [Metarhizium album ARSEF 1941]KHN93744.1 phospholipase D [Metarhizium album ARSEF 1941]